MDQFLERQNIPKFIQGETANMNSPMFVIEIKSIINKLPKQEAPGTDGFTGEFYQTFKEEITPIIYNLFQKIEAEGILPNSFHEDGIRLITKLKTLQERKTINHYLSSTQIQKSSMKYQQATSNNI